MTEVRRRFLTIGLAIALAVPIVCRAPLSADERAGATNHVVYESEVQSIIAVACVRCHNPETRKAGIDLTTPQGIMLGGDSGQIVNAGQPAESLLFEMIESG